MGDLIRLVVLLVAAAASIAQNAIPPSFRVSGLVLFPDGKPSAGATVTGTTTCEGEPYHSQQTAKTSSTGAFDLRFQDTACTRIRLSASNEDELWLKTGPGIFYTRESGTSPIVQATVDGAPTKAVISLGERGGLVAFRVWDKATGRFIYAAVNLERLPVQGATFGSMLFATGRDGSADPLFLPAGEYRFSVQQFACNGADYFAAANAPHGTFTVIAGQRVSEDFSVDVRQIKPTKSQSSPHGRPCVPTQP
jgi:hypothetical protein